MYIYRSARDVPIVVVDCIENRNFTTFFLESTQISNFVNIRPVEAEFFRADRWTDRQEEA
jgi:hypothetical protein